MQKLVLENKIQELKKLLSKEEIEMTESNSFDKEIREIERSYRTDIYFNEQSSDYKNDEAYDSFIKHLDDIKSYKEAKQELELILKQEEEIRKKEEEERIKKEEENKKVNILDIVLNTEIKEKEPVVEEKKEIKIDEQLSDKIDLVDRLCQFFISDMNRRWFNQLVKYHEEMTKFNDKYKNYYASAESRTDLNRIYSIYPEWLRNITNEEYNKIIKKYIEIVKKYIESKMSEMTIDDIKLYCSSKFNKHLQDIINEVKPMI